MSGKLCGIYMVTSPSNRVYIGQSLNIYKRFNSYKKMYVKNKGQTVLHRSFIKYGVDNHKFIILEECNEIELNIKERYYQDLYNVLEGGLNCRLTKTIDKSGSVSQETRIKMSEASKGNKHWLNKKHTQETKDKISKANTGRRYSDEVNKKKGRPNVIPPNKGLFSKDNPLSKPLVQLNIDNTFVKKWDCLMDVKRNLGFNICNINSCMRGKLKKSTGFKWMYLIDYENK